MLLSLFHFHKPILRELVKYVSIKFQLSKFTIFAAFLIQLLFCLLHCPAQLLGI